MQQTDTTLIIGNPIIKHKYTADPTALVYGDTVFIYTGHDEAPAGTEEYLMNEWLCFSSSDLVNWIEYPSPLKATDFKWANGKAYASKVIELNGEFFWYVAVNHATAPGAAIGVAKSKNPTGPFVDARGAALITIDMLPKFVDEKANLDPTVIIDDNGEAYMYWGSSNRYPIRAKTLDKEKRFRPSEKTWELFNLDGKKHGWERFGENHSDTVLGGYIEGPWMTKHNGRYYLQYAAPGTEYNVYGDGAYISDSPLGPFTYMPNNPFSYKPGGFINGAGHGSTLVGPNDLYWHFASMAVSVNVNWERRLCMYPTWFDDKGLMHSDTRFGDYPHYAPAIPGSQGEFRGWMLVSYKKPVKASSVFENYDVKNIVDENVKTFWVAQENDDKQWIEIDLIDPAKVFAIQLNYHDYKSDLYGKIPGLYHRYVIEGSADRKSWITLVDRKNNFKDKKEAS